MGINLIYSAYAIGGLALAVSWATWLPSFVVDILNFLYPFGLPGGLLGVLLLAMRVCIGVLFVLHGKPKITHLHARSKDLGMPVFLCFLSALSMFLGGFFMIIGFLTPLDSLAILGSMLFAMLLEMSKGSPFVARDPFQIPDNEYEGPNGKGDPPSWEKAFLYVVILSAISILGPGAFSLDALIFR